MAISIILIAIVLSITKGSLPKSYLEFYFAKLCSVSMPPKKWETKYLPPYFQRNERDYEGRLSVIPGRRRWMPRTRRRRSRWLMMPGRWMQWSSQGVSSPIQGYWWSRHWSSVQNWPLHENRCVREARKAWVWQLIDDYFDQKLNHSRRSNLVHVLTPCNYESMGVGLWQWVWQQVESNPKTVVKYWHTDILTYWHTIEYSDIIY